jgi:hypothetical protein
VPASWSRIVWRLAGEGLVRAWFSEAGHEEPGQTRRTSRLHALDLRGARARCAEGVYVEVRFSGGGGWGATLYTSEVVRAILDEWRHVGGEHSGLYFWAPGVILIRELAPFEHIVALVEDLIAEDELDLTFAPLEHDRYAP